MARFARRARLLSAGDFASVFDNGVRFHEGPVTAVVMDYGGQRPRLGLAVSRKAVPMAAQRNRVKRQVRESFRYAADQLPPLAVVILARPAAQGADNATLRHALSRLWERITQECRKS